MSNKNFWVFMVAPCINNIKYFIVQLMHSIIEIVEFYIFNVFLISLQFI